LREGYSIDVKVSEKRRMHLHGFAFPGFLAKSIFHLMQRRCTPSRWNWTSILLLARDNFRERELNEAIGAADVEITHGSGYSPVGYSTGCDNCWNYGFPGMKVVTTAVPSNKPGLGEDC
jgi:hypothetical protein